MTYDTYMEKTTTASIYSGQVVKAGYKRRTLLVDPARFVGFKVGENVYSSLKLLKTAFGVRNLRDLEAEADRLELGSVTAEFYDTEGRFFWGSYLYRGRFCVGTSADRLVLCAG